MILVEGEAPQVSMPPRLMAYVTRYAQLTPAQQTRLLEGEPVTRMLDSDGSRELAVFGAVWIKAPIARYVSAVKDIEQFEKGGNFLVTKRISDQPRLERFRTAHPAARRRRRSEVLQGWIVRSEAG